jgi:uncharacterized membrane protein
VFAAPELALSVARSMLHSSRMRHGSHPRVGIAHGAVITTAALAVFTAVVIARGRRSPRLIPKRRPDMPTLAGGRGLRVERAVTIMRSADDLYRRWRDLSRLPELMPFLESVTPIDRSRSRWVARGPLDARVAWEAEIVADEPGRLLAWRSLGDADVDNAGSVRFTPGPNDRRTEVKVQISFAPPAGKTAGVVASLFGRDGDRQVRESLRRFKQQMETEEEAVGARNRRDAAAAHDRRFRAH